MGRFTPIKIVACTLFISISLCVFGKAGYAQETRIKVANWYAVGHKQDLLLKSYCEDLEKRAGGKLKVKYYPAGTLVSTVQQYDAVVKGIADIGNHVLGYTMGRFPFSQILDFPLGFPQGAAPTMIANEFYKKFKPKEFDEVKVLWFHAQPAGFLHTKTRPVAKLEDIKGLKLRCYGSNARFVSLLGAAPVAMPMTDVYDALSKGVVDGLMSSYESLHGWKTGEHIKYSTENRSTAYSAVFLVMMNKKKFASLPPDIQALIDRMSEEYIEKYGKMWADQNTVAADWLKKRGVKIVTLTKEEEARWYEKGAKPLVDEYIKEMNAAGLPGEQAVRFIQDAIKRYKK
jgi:TRAP-type C4-dicarboxylate transport system substrate-binding protein